MVPLAFTSWLQTSNNTTLFLNSFNTMLEKQVILKVLIIVAKSIYNFKVKMLMAEKLSEKWIIIHCMISICKLKSQVFFEK